MINKNSSNNPNKLYKLDNDKKFYSVFFNYSVKFRNFDTE